MFRTLRAKLLIVFILITFIPMSAVGVISHTLQKQEITNNIERLISLQSYSLTKEVQRFIEEKLMDVEYFAQNPVLIDPESTELEVREQLYTFLDTHDIYGSIILLDEEGIVTAGVETSVIGRDLSEREWFQKALDGETSMSDLYVSPILNEPMLVLAAPIYNVDQELIGVVSPSFKLGFVYDMLQNYTVEQQDAGWGGYTFILNSEGDVVGHPDGEKLLTANYFEQKNIPRETVEELINNYEVAETVDGEVYSFSTMHPIPGFDHVWYVGIAMEETELYAPLNGLLIGYLVVFSIVLIILTFVAYGLSKYLLRPIGHLIETTKRMAAGSRDNQQFVNAYEEVNQLNETFKQMTTELDERETYQRKAVGVIEATDNGVFAIDRVTKQLTLFNRKCEEIFEVEKNDVIDKTIDHLMDESPHFEALVHKSQLFELLDKAETATQFEVDCGYGGSHKTLFLSVTTLPGAENSHDELLIVFYDLTEKRKMEKELLRSEKLKVAGEMSAGFAHEIRNPLTTIKGFIKLFDEQDGKMKPKYYKLVMDEIDRVTKIVNELLNIANPNVCEEKTKVNIDGMLENILTLYEGHMNRHHIELETFLHGTLPDIEADSNKLKQVLINLIQNGIEAMPDGGRMNVHTKLGHAENSEKVIVIRVEDTGEGMDKDTMDKLGTPFFTTKETGTGLGLTTSFRVIEEMAGTIKVSSTQEKGTVFTISIPVHVPSEETENKKQ
ncbi:ATP-binding protein [Salipaludibacillus sp. LMS25]|uniref:PAS domain-containing sensor histidine kinase n=1 Tax=Salipaludibacillus sp. LMS25 TaxID=2924031 RepID=UPI0020D1528D|nr:PAS domain-containing sensor histidine kinase [Salipaludibacillus sp. LMS25]UTR16336.1 ATP-binding protein [Salipaludibacillus sp. LMS25]